MDDGEDVIVPDEAARLAYFLKWADRPAYDEMMREQAAKLDESHERPPVREEDAFDVEAVAAWLRDNAGDASGSRARRRCGSSPAARPT